MGRLARMLGSGALLTAVTLLPAYGGEALQVLFVGDTCFGTTYPQTMAELVRLGHAADAYIYSQSALKPFLSEQDAVIVNLETPLARNGQGTPISGSKDYIHRDPPDAASALAENGVRTVSLGNNHALDLGVGGLTATRQALALAGVSFFGAGDTSDSANAPWTATWTVAESPFAIAVFGAFEERASYRDRYHWYAERDRPGVASFDASVLADRIKRLRREEPNVFVVVFPHWGGNYQQRYERQVTMAHAAIDAGADLVLGHGPHMAQQLERYHDKWIVYSLGNGILLTPGRYRLAGVDGISLLAQLRVEQPANGKLVRSLRLYPIDSDNLRTQYQPRLLPADRSRAFLERLAKESGLTAGGTTGAVRDDGQGRICIQLGL